MLNKLTNLQYLKFDRSLYSFSAEYPTLISTNLRELHINVRDMDDCLYILNGSFDRLHTFNVTMEYILPRIKVENKVEISKFKKLI